MSPKATLRWPVTVTRAWLSNIGAVLREASPRDVIPPWVWERVWTTLGWVREQFPKAAGYRSTPYEQMTGALAIAGLLVLTSPLSAGAKLLLLPIPVLLVIIGAARLHPVADRLWPLASTNGGEPV